ncbi:succinoglycan biosynthesis protein exov [Alteromonas sediminis]|uniref:Succinoglycan biosynthesis protein exov n=1 Tax=Alteromonas sediminis TaxID=2259342 RepID=A0A3N5Z5S9_9ALTE|nr:polysaccharide pyruvyl transferase family protein [Alteromonas sediminis]RPJ65724.1 succinoglycan biosynthesis protein exov [Alteromonas sediminis]
MKLYYWESTHGNVGDDINPWLWKRLLPGKFDDNENLLFIGIGTLLNHHIPIADRYIVATSGFGYGEEPKIDERWEFLAVRGKRTIEALNLPDETLTLDGAYLLSKYIDISGIDKTDDISYIPHVFSMEKADWDHFSRLTNVNVIDPRLAVEDFIIKLAKSRAVICEAMHGAIIADTFGIPWLPVKMYDHINENKWLDWTESFDLGIEFNYLKPIWIGDKKKSKKVQFKNKIKRNLIGMNLFSGKFDAPPPKASKDEDLKRLANELKNIQKKEFYLCDRDLMNSKLNTLIELLSDKFDTEIKFTKVILNP